MRNGIMAIQALAGDLFENAYHAQALAHGCNCQGSMGAGIAVGFRERYPKMYEEYLPASESETGEST
jgi:O-acetyl-ADP-ribose deacetylase (regulator of RNase III)